MSKLRNTPPLRTSSAVTSNGASPFCSMTPALSTTRLASPASKVPPSQVSVPLPKVRPCSCCQCPRWVTSTPLSVSVAGVARLPPAAIVTEPRVVPPPASVVTAVSVVPLPMTKRAPPRTCTTS
ncbi:MAG: hypothetical protein U1F43_18480 [Myxococcota bacterium]